MDQFWEQTKDLDVPWGELDIGSVIFTLPSESLRKIKNPKNIQNMFDTIVKEISQFMAFPLERAYRIVFDIQLTSSEPNSSYPLVFLIKDINGILIENSKPNDALFSAVTYMGIISIREESLDSVTEMALATVCAASIFQKLFKGFNPISFLGDNAPKLFPELWEIHTQFDSRLLPKVLKKFQDASIPPSDAPEGMWISFVREICSIGEKNFTKLLEKAKPIPLNIMRSLNNYQEYVSEK